MAKSIRDLQAALEQMGEDIEDNVEQAVDKNLKAIERDAKNTIARSDSMATHQLFNAFRRFEDKTGRKNRYILSNGAPHAAFVEFGTGPQNVATRPEFKFKAPALTGGLVNAIKFWMRVKPVQPRFSLERSAYLIAKSISNEGTPPVRYFASAWFQYERPLRLDARKAVKKAVRRAAR